MLTERRRRRIRRVQWGKLVWMVKCAITVPVGKYVGQSASASGKNACSHNTTQRSKDCSGRLMLYVAVRLKAAKMSGIHMLDI